VKSLPELFENNAKWRQSIEEEIPGFFETLARQQAPKILWIGCADSRVPANQIVGLMPGEVFVHRNVSNMVIHTDLNMLSVLQFAVEVLKVEHVIITGHYGCGGVGAAMEDQSHGLIDNWLREIRELYLGHLDEINALPEAQRRDRLCELNVARQVMNMGNTTVVQDAWKRGQKLNIHGWIYSLSNGQLHDLDLTVQSDQELRAAEANQR